MFATGSAKSDPPSIEWDCQNPCRNLTPPSLLLSLPPSLPPSLFFYIIFLSHGKITIRDGNFTDIDGLDPTITWQNSALLSNDVALRVSDYFRPVHSLVRPVLRAFLYVLSLPLHLSPTEPNRQTYSRAFFPLHFHRCYFVTSFFDVNHCHRCDDWFFSQKNPSRRTFFSRSILLAPLSLRKKNIYSTASTSRRARRTWHPSPVEYGAGRPASSSIGTPYRRVSNWTSNART